MWRKDRSSTLELSLINKFTRIIGDILPDLVLMDEIESRLSFSKHHEEIVPLKMLQTINSTSLKKFTEDVSKPEVCGALLSMATKIPRDQT